MLRNVLLFLTALLLARRRIAPHWGAFGLGALAGGLTLLPLLSSAVSGTLPSSLPRQGFIGRGLLFVLPMLKVVPYWLRLPTLDIGTPLRQVVYLNGGRGAPMLVCRALQVLSTATLLLSVATAWWYWTRWRSRGPVPTPYGWFEHYAARAHGMVSR